MSDIATIIRKLRRAADALDDLLSTVPADNPAAARRIRSAVDRNLARPKGNGTRPRPRHWTQRPENAARLRAQLRRAVRASVASRKSLKRKES